MQAAAPYKEAHIQVCYLNFKLPPQGEAGGRKRQDGHCLVAPTGIHTSSATRRFSPFFSGDLLSLNHCQESDPFTAWAPCEPSHLLQTQTFACLLSLTSFFFLPMFRSTLLMEKERHFSLHLQAWVEDCWLQVRKQTPLKDLLQNGTFEANRDAKQTRGWSLAKRLHASSWLSNIFTSLLAHTQLC